jgi:MHS family proline/betaine transporter-like MFS transporter
MESLTSDQRRNLRNVILASSVGTLIEWYDFYIFGSLAAILAEQFFPKANPTAAFLSTLATFAAGFVVRPFGALVFGRLGDIVGRKYTFLVTLVLMGGATFAIGLVPGYESIGLAAPAIVLTLRLLQGLALGGEYGGAATYVAEHAPAARRGYYTSFIQTTATLGLLLSLGVILLVRQGMGMEDFAEYGWRIPFLVSALLVGISIYIRLRMSESPLFAKIKAEGRTSKNPLKESFARKENLRLVLLALFGATAGQGVVWYTGQFYALSFIQKTCHIEFVQSNYIMALALILATPLFIVFGRWSDWMGRKYIMLAGMLLAIFSYRPIYRQMVALTDPLSRPQTEVRSDEKWVTTPSDSIRVVTVTQIFQDDSRMVIEKQEALRAGTVTETKREMKLAGGSYYTLVGLIFIQVVFVTMVYGPIAAFLVELFPTRIRYTSLSLPYHIGNGIFGGLTPFIATSLYELSKTPGNPGGDPFAGLWYPIAVAAVTFVIGLIFLPRKIRAEVLE